MCINLPSISKTLKESIDIFRRDIFKKYSKSNFIWKDAANSYSGFFYIKILSYFVIFLSILILRQRSVLSRSKQTANFVKKIQESGFLDSGFGVWSMPFEKHLVIFNWPRSISKNKDHANQLGFS
jgi:hypothetical protein